MRLVNARLHRPTVWPHLVVHTRVCADRQLNIACILFLPTFILKYRPLYAGRRLKCHACTSPVGAMRRWTVAD
jgi:hypothetical protein